jgi:hypothetical protein
MSAISFTDKMAEDVLSGEIYAPRFEKLCSELFSLVDGIQYVTTSQSWDLGRDGRSAMLP